MDSDPETTREAVFRSTERKAAREPALVLAAVGIDSELVAVEGQLWLVVAATDAGRARRELRLYLDENRRAQRERVPFEPIANGLAVALTWVLSLVLARAAVLFDLAGVDWTTLGRADAARMVDGGEWWRAGTALLLHADALHLAGNLVFGALFAVFLAHSVGSGGAALLLVLSGCLGNAINAFVRHPEHLSVGASTAVFGAVGAFVALEFLRRRRDERDSVRRWAPVLIGVLILGWFGSGGERTDVTAHLFGFLGGFVLALLGGLVERRRAAVAARRFQRACWTLAGLLIAGAWSWALLAGTGG